MCEVIATGVPPGWGEPVFDKLKADLAMLLLSLPAVMAFEYGRFRRSDARGSQNDLFVRQSDAAHRHESNRHGGMLEASAAAG